MEGFWLALMTLRLPLRKQGTHAHAQARTLTWTHLTLLQTRGWHIFFLLPLTGSIKGQSAAEPHAARQQRDTADYRATGRHTMDGGRVFGERGSCSGRETEDGKRDGRGWGGQGRGRGERGLFLDFPFGTKLLPVLSKWDINSFVCRGENFSIRMFGFVVPGKHWSVPRRFIPIHVRISCSLGAAWVMQGWGFRSGNHVMN